MIWRVFRMLFEAVVIAAFLAAVLLVTWGLGGL